MDQQDRQHLNQTHGPTHTTQSGKTIPTPGHGIELIVRYARRTGWTVAEQKGYQQGKDRQQQQQDGVNELHDQS